MTGLLNPPLQARACQSMLDHISEQLQKVEYQLTHSILDRDVYLMSITEAIKLRAILTDLTTIYQRTFAAS